MKKKSQDYVCKNENTMLQNENKANTNKVLAYYEIMRYMFIYVCNDLKAMMTYFPLH